MYSCLEGKVGHTSLDHFWEITLTCNSINLHSTFIYSAFGILSFGFIDFQHLSGHSYSNLHVTL